VKYFPEFACKSITPEKYTKMRAILVGATGLVGGLLLQQLLDDSLFESVKVIGRRPTGLSHPKLVELTMDLVNDPDFEAHVSGADAFFACMGTTQANVKGDKNLYRKIDYDLPVRAARACAANGINSFLVVSSVGADAKSNNFYLRLKGEMEAEVLKQPVSSIYIFRPSMILGNRKEKRTGESIAKFIMPLASLFLLGSLSRFKSIEAVDIATAMRACALNAEKGHHVLQYNEIKQKLGN
jgi:uncharacterized protein YbjT (DUF2867 family)